jgi:hypothetical protein
MKKMLKKIGSTPKSQVISKSRKPVAKPVPARNAKPDFIGRLKGAFRIVGDIESPVVPAEEWECCREDDLERINQVAEGINAESADVLDYQNIRRTRFHSAPKNAGRSARATRANRSTPAPNA